MSDPSDFPGHPEHPATAPKTGGRFGQRQAALDWKEAAGRAELDDHSDILKAIEEAGDDAQGMYHAGVQRALEERRSSEAKPLNPKDSVGVRKAPASVVPQGVVAELGLAMLEGARKYGRHNYRAAGIIASVNYDAARGHIDAWWEGEDIDPDSQLSHITKAIAALVVLRDGMQSGNWVDDRPPALPPEYRPRSKSMNAKAAAIIDAYPDALPAFTNKPAT
jgi:hypothetical protein